MSDGIVLVAEELHPDEAAWLLAEVHDSLDGRHIHRYQAIYVYRNDRLFRHTRDLGLAEQYNNPPFRIPALNEHTVGEVMDMADQWRDDNWAERRLVELSEQSTLNSDWLRQLDEDRKLVANQSTFGPGGSVQRNGYSRTAARIRKERKLNDHG